MTTPLFAVANDLGYSSMKIGIKNCQKPTSNNQFFESQDIIPSAIVVQQVQDYNKPVVFNTRKEQDNYFADLQDHIDVTITSPTVNLPGRFLVGQRAIDSGLPKREFDVNDYTGKADSDLSVILTLSRIASQVVTDAYQTHQDLNKILPAQVIMTTNLPIVEGKRPNVNDNYKQRYLNGKHLVTFHNFNQPITVELKFKTVYVGLEGEMAQFAIANADQNLKQAILTDFIHSYPKLKNQVSADDLISLKNILGIDIGEGTTDYEVVVNGRANASASLSMSTGYGNVLQEAVSILQGEQMNVTDRGALASFLAEHVTFPPKKARQDHAKEVVYDQLSQFVDQIIDKTSEVMRHAGNNTDLVYVYGGGSIPLLTQTDMRKRLVKKLQGFSGGYDIPVIWIDPKYAQEMNEKGLTLYLQYLLVKNNQ